MTARLRYGATHTGGEGTPLVLLHGAGANWRAWLRTLPLLEEHHAVYAPTLPGHHGGSQLLAGQRPSISALVDALERQLDAAGIGTAHIAGNSLGGWLALELARRGRARSVVALSPAGGWTTPRNARALRAKFYVGHRASSVLSKRADLFVAVPGARALVLRPLSRGADVSRQEVAELVRAAGRCPIMPELIRSTVKEGGFTLLEDHTCPIRIAWSENDKVLPFRRFGRPMLALVPAAEHVMIPRAGHVPMLDQPRAVVDTILDVTAAVDAL